MAGIGRKAVANLQGPRSRSMTFPRPPKSLSLMKLPTLLTFLDNPTYLSVILQSVELSRVIRIEVVCHAIYRDSRICSVLHRAGEGSRKTAPSRPNISSITAKTYPRN